MLTLLTGTYISHFYRFSYLFQPFDAAEEAIPSRFHHVGSPDFLTSKSLRHPKYGDAVAVSCPPFLESFIPLEFSYKQRLSFKGFVLRSKFPWACVITLHRQ